METFLTEEDREIEYFSCSLDDDDDDDEILFKFGYVTTALTCVKS